MFCLLEAGQKCGSENGFITSTCRVSSLNISKFWGFKMIKIIFPVNKYLYVGKTPQNSVRLYQEKVKHLRKDKCTVWSDNFGDLYGTLKAENQNIAFLYTWWVIWCTGEPFRAVFHLHVTDILHRRQSAVCLFQLLPRKMFPLCLPDVAVIKSVCSHSWLSAGEINLDDTVLQAETARGTWIWCRVLRALPFWVILFIRRCMIQNSTGFRLLNLPSWNLYSYINQRRTGFWSPRNMERSRKLTYMHVNISQEH